MKTPLDLDPKRLFSRKQKAEIFTRAKGRCEICNRKLGPNEPWIAGHKIDHGCGGETVVENGQVECVKCSKETARESKQRTAKADRQGGRTGQQARRGRNGPQIKSPGFDKRFRKKMNGEVVRRENEPD